MELKSIPTEVVIALISGQYAFMIMFWNKMDKIWKSISEIEKNYVQHAECYQQRKDCPCRIEIEHLKELGELKDKRK